MRIYLSGVTHKNDEPYCVSKSIIDAYEHAINKLFPGATVFNPTREILEDTPKETEAMIRYQEITADDVNGYCEKPYYDVLVEVREGVFDEICYNESCIARNIGIPTVSFQALLLQAEQ